MNQQSFPEIESATEALQKRIALTEAEVAELKDTIKAKKALVRSWRKALAAFNPTVATRKRKTTATPA